MTRPTFTPQYEESENIIKNRMLTNIPDTWRKDVGDFTYDVVAPASPEIKLLQIQQDEIVKNSFAMYAEGEYLDYKLTEIGLTRGQPTPNVRKLNVHADAGVVIPAGHKAVTVVLDSGGNPLEYTFSKTTAFATTGVLSLEITCKTPGTIGNVTTGSQFIILPPIPGVRSITDAGTVIPGTDTETDESAWQRYEFKVKNPDTGGNKNDYIRWAEEVTGVGKVKVIPRFMGPGSVKVILTGTDYLPAAAEVVADVQAYLDPFIGETAETEEWEMDGYGVTVDETATGDSLNSLKFVYDEAGEGMATLYETLETLVETGNQYTADFTIKVDDSTQTTDLLKITFKNRVTGTPLQQTKDGASDAVLLLNASQLSTAFGEVTLPFYWDGYQPLALEVRRLATDTTTTVWVDKMHITSPYGQGLGWGKAPGGARVLVKSADPHVINIAANVAYTSAADPAAVKQTFSDSVEAYLKTQVFTSDSAIIYAVIGSLLITTPGVKNYSNLTVNGAEDDVILGVEESPVLGTVIFNG